jgi:hypothetical protein
MNAKQLSQLNNNVKKLIEDFILKNNMTLTEFSRNAGIHQSHLWVYMRGNVENKSLNSSTLEKIGKFLIKK